MHFRYSDEQQAFRDTIRRALEQHDFAARGRAIAADPGYSRALWQQLADLGVLALTFPEEVGGLDGGAVGRMIVAEELGRVIAPEPWLASVVLGGGAVQRAGTPAQRAAILPAVMAGEKLLALAVFEPGSGEDILRIATRAQADWYLSGTKVLVWHGDSADLLVVSALSDQGPSLFLVDAKAPGVTRQAMQTQDGQRMARITLDNVPAEPLGTPGQAAEVLLHLECDAIAALAAEAVGVIEESIRQTVDYLRIRVQFGQPLANFQVLQHRGAELVVDLEMARSMAIHAAMSEGLPLAERRRALSAVKLHIGRSGRKIGQATVQMHGGIGVTMENRIGHWFKRLEVINQAFGNADHHLRRLIEA